MHDGSDEVLALFPHTVSGTGAVKKATAAGHQGNTYGRENRPAGTPNIEYGDAGSAARFYYCAKPSKAEKGDTTHPTVKPLALMRWLCRHFTPPGGHILDPFAGSGTTGRAALDEGFQVTLIEREPKHAAEIPLRVPEVHGV
jgi:site-specific DNA-methyltransferase (adenine-specific)